MSELLYTQACEDRDFVEWHRGCLWCAVWVVRLDEEVVQALVDRARAAVAPFVLPRYARQPHITVAYRGLMADGAASAYAEFGALQLHEDVQRLQAAQLQPFEVQLQGVASFATVPYVPVRPHAVLQRSHHALAVLPYPHWHYVPHLTLGHYGCTVPIQQVLAAVHAAVPADALQCAQQVDALWLARYRTEDIAGALHFEGHFDLRTQRYHPQAAALLPVAGFHG